MLSQIALHPDLPNPFKMISLSPKEVDNPSKELTLELRQSFENNQILVIEGFYPEEIDFFLKIPGREFDDWVPPLFDYQILKDISPQHQLLDYYDEGTVDAFQKKLVKFQKSFEQFHDRIFAGYSTTERFWSWRMNKMSHGYLHLDVPDNYEEHQMRTFINLGRRARVLEIGPTFPSLARKEYKESQLDELNDLDNQNYLQAIKDRVFSQKQYEEFYLPRHYLRLAPGACWISHSSMITHGLVSGEKTVCYETRIPREDLIDSKKHFNEVVARVKNNQEPEAYDFKIHDREIR